MNRLKQLLDSIEFFWSRWVVGYDLGRQLDLARNLERGVGGRGHAGPRPAFAWKRLIMPAGIVVVLGIAWGLWRRRRPVATGSRGGQTPLPHAVGRLYRRALERLARQGLQRQPTETPRELAARVRRAALQGGDAFTELTELYLQARFGRREIDDHRLSELSRRLLHLGEPANMDTATRAA